MTKLKEMYAVLEQIIESTEKRDRKKVEELSKKLNDLSLGLYDDNPTFMDSDYDNCRQSCIFAIQISPMYEESITNAKEIFSKIPKPED